MRGEFLSTHSTHFLPRVLQTYAIPWFLLRTVLVLSNPPRSHTHAHILPEFSSRPSRVLASYVVYINVVHKIALNIYTPIYMFQLLHVRPGLSLTNTFVHKRARHYTGTLTLTHTHTHLRESTSHRITVKSSGSRAHTQLCTHRNKKHT